MAAGVVPGPPTWPNVPGRGRETIRNAWPALGETIRKLLPALGETIRDALDRSRPADWRPDAVGPRCRSTVRWRPMQTDGSMTPGEWTPGEWTPGEWTPGEWTP